MKNILLISIIFLLSSCMKLYSYPGGNTGNFSPSATPNTTPNYGGMVNAPPPGMFEENQMPPNFQQQTMQMQNQYPGGSFKNESLPPNSASKYPQNVPYPYGMTRKYKNYNDKDSSVKDLESLSKPQYRGGDHYKSRQFQESLND